MRLLAVELTRLRSRRAYWFLVLLALAGVALAIGSTVSAAQPPSAADIAEAQAQVDAQTVDPFTQEQVDRCRDAHAEGGTAEFPMEFDCAEMLPRLDWFLYYEEPNFVQDLEGLLPPATLMLAMAGALIGATFVGAEWSAGTIATHLLFEPRRGRVFASKAGAVSIGLALPALIGLGAVYVGTWFAASKWGSTELVVSSYETTPTGEGLEVASPVSWLDLTLFGLRGLAVVAGAAVGGYVLAMAFRSSLAAVGTVAAYGLVGEGLVRSLWSGAEPWLLSVRLNAWLTGGSELFDYPEACETGIGPCMPDVTTITTVDGGLYLAGLLLAGVVVAYLLFRRRDIT